MKKIFSANTRARTAARSIRTGLIALLAIAVIAVLFAGPAEAHRKRNVWEQRRHIKKRVKSVIGTRYQYGGSSRGGFDCSGLTRWTWDGHGASLPHSSMRQWKRGSRNDHKRIWKKKKLKVGDLVFHKTTSARVGHVGIYIGRGRFVSATSSEGVRVRSIYDPYYWGRRWVGAVRLPATIRG